MGGWLWGMICGMFFEGKKVFLSQQQSNLYVQESVGTPLNCNCTWFIYKIITV